MPRREPSRESHFNSYVHYEPCLWDGPCVCQVSLEFEFRAWVVIEGGPGTWRGQKVKRLLIEKTRVLHIEVSEIEDRDGNWSVEVPFHTAAGR